MGSWFVTRYIACIALNRVFIVNENGMAPQLTARLAGKKMLRLSAFNYPNFRCLVGQKSYANRRLV